VGVKRGCWPNFTPNAVRCAFLFDDSIDLQALQAQFSLWKARRLCVMWAAVARATAGTKYIDKEREILVAVVGALEKWISGRCDGGDGGWAGCAI
jgi:hypothetical protein